MTSEFKHITVSEHIYRHTEITGFEHKNAVFQTLREFIENGIDSCEKGRILPDITSKVVELGDDFYEIYVSDNGIGVPDKDIPLAFATPLTSTKYNLRQERGIYGLGGKNAIIYSQKHTQKHFTVASSPLTMYGRGDRKVYIYKLKIDITNNKPIVLERKELPNKDNWHGCTIRIITLGKFDLKEIMEYLKRTATVLPYANLTFVYKPKNTDDSRVTFKRNVNIVHKFPNLVRPHPHGIDAESLRRIISETKAVNLKDFLSKHFQRMGSVVVQKFLKDNKLSPNTDPKSLNEENIVKLASAMRMFKGFLTPDVKCLSMIGEENFVKGIQKEYECDFVAYTKRRNVYGGHPYIVEVCLAYGGKIETKNNFRRNLFRYCNKIPLIHDWSSCILRKAVDNTPFQFYSVEDNMPIGIFIHLCSTNPPYAAVGKEFLRDIEEIREVVENALKDCGRKLKGFLSQRHRLEYDKRRKSVFDMYSPIFSEKLSYIVEKPQNLIDDYINKVLRRG